MLTLNVPLPNKTYPIYTGTNLNISTLLEKHVLTQQIMIVTNTTVSPLYLESLVIRHLPQTTQIAVCTLPDGEQYKTLHSYQLVLDALMEARFARDCLIIALGGGVIGDIAGFCAASFQRGVDFIQIPTTLLSQVDSSVGGKTGVNHPLGKNMIGAFKQPIAVIAETSVLNTLSARDFSAGLAEIIKYALIKDLSFLVWLEENMRGLVAKDPILLEAAIYRSCQYKADIVSADEFEGGVRALLNFGHTFGHAIETNQGYGEFLHGEAVAIGMLMACDLSQRMGLLSPEDVIRVRNLLVAAQLPVDVPDMSTDDFMHAMAQDKKVLKGNIRLILLKKLGDAFITSDYPKESLLQTLQQHRPGIYTC